MNSLDITNLQCMYCKHLFSNKSNLAIHLRTVKRCKKNIDTNDSCYNCEFCKKNFTVKNSLQVHLSTCKEKLKKDAIIKTEEELDKELSKKIDKIKNQLIDEKEDVIEQLTSEKRDIEEQYQYQLKLKDERIKELELQLKEKNQKVIHNKINKNKITNNTIHNHFTINEIMTPERVEEYFKKNYNLETLMGGQKALARMVADGFIMEKDNYLCVVRSRKKFVMCDGERKVEDTDCQNLVDLTVSGMPIVKDVYEDAMFRNHETVTESEIQDNYRSVSNLDKERSEFTTELSRIIPSSENVSTQRHRTTQIFDMMRKSIIPSEPKQNQDIIKEEQPLTIGGFTLGKLDIYRQSYRKKKQIAKDEDVPIKGPKSLLEQFELYPFMKEQYIEFIKS